ncbi:MAG: undecaprenyl/decaprenyl-phosphate alpha-N-acetylglucosaminyl 1-phosphate transferase [Paludibacteraceae bacterium]|nr:undecaprenyl/decaprenyl-phosphate alpha-N-acetylglucosaminyl 1-phosphate transferase [Paludibacteraceae bacterium]
MLTFVYNHLYLVGIFSFVLGLILMPLVIRIAKQKDLVVRPNKRMSHTGSIPNIGGIDICVSFLLTYLVLEFNTLQQSQFLLIGVFTIVAVGLVDDILILSPLGKLLGEVLAAIAMIGFADLRITHLHGLLGIEQISVLPSYLISLFVLVAIINAINLIDGIDGLASGLGMIYCLFFAIYFMLVGETAWAIMAISLIGSLAVYFIFNVFGHKQKIFMGDSGALLLGYVLSAFVFHFCELNAYNQVPVPFHMSAAPAVAICVLTVPIFDTIRVSLTRIKHRKSPFRPDKNHIHHLLLRTGLNHLQTTGILLTISLCFIVLALIGRNWNMWLLVGLDFTIATVLTVILWRIIDRKNAQNAQNA